MAKKKVVCVCDRGDVEAKAGRKSSWQDDV